MIALLFRHEPQAFIPSIGLPSLDERKQHWNGSKAASRKFELYIHANTAETQCYPLSPKHKLFIKI